MMAMNHIESSFCRVSFRGGGAGVLAPSPVKLSVVTCTKPNNNRNVNNWSNDSKILKNLPSNAIYNMYKYLLVPN